MIKDRRIEISTDEALALASRGATVECIADEGGMMTIWEAIAGLAFFAPESALTAFNDEPAQKPADTPEKRTQAILASVERHDALAEEYAGDAK